jgi:multicomponent Na+:H+ antiporter subunit F
MAAVGIGFIAAYAVYTEEKVLLDVATVVALISFLATVAFAFYVQRGA